MRKLFAVVVDGGRRKSNEKFYAKYFVSSTERFKSIKCVAKKTVSYCKVTLVVLLARMKAVVPSFFSHFFLFSIRMKYIKKSPRYFITA